jgi:hypothetical protein
MRITSDRLSDMLASWEHMPPDTNTCADIAVDLQECRAEQEASVKTYQEMYRLAERSMSTMMRALAVIEGPPTMNPDRVPTALALRAALAAAEEWWALAEQVAIGVNRWSYLKAIAREDARSDQQPLNEAEGK